MTLPSLMPPVDSSQLADAGNLAALKRAAASNNPQALRAAARQFESLFVSMVLKSVRQANFKDPLFGSDQGNLYQDMYDDQVAAEISKGKGLGLADMLVQQLRSEQPGAASSSKAAPSSDASQAASGPPKGALPVSGTGAVGIGTVVASPATGQSGPVDLASSEPPGATAAGAVNRSGRVAQRGEPCPTSAEQASFARMLWPDAQQASRQLGVSPVTLLAQAALETDWGRSMPRDAGGATSNNLFGIKATSAWGGPAVESGTKEYSGGLASTVTAQFRSYGSPGECFQDYVALLRGSPRYAAALGTGSNVQAFGSALQQGGYATDPAYASKLTAVAGTLARALAPQDPSAAVRAPRMAGAQSAEPLKLAANLPTTSGSGALQRR